MKRPPTPRSGVYELYWEFAAKRQEAFMNRIAGKSWPWSDDLILREYKFCNVYRAADRVSQYLIRNVAYNQEASEPEDRLFQILAFRLFSRNETWESIRNFLGRAPLLDDLKSESFTKAIEYAKSENGGLYTNAFILCATNAYKQDSKYLNHVALLRDMFLTNNVGEKILEAKNLREVYDNIHSFPLMGDFMSYQIAIDLNYCAHVNFSENEFTQAGPGAVRGLRKAFVDLGDFSANDAILWMVEHQEEEFKRLDLQFDGLWGRPLHAIDCQGLFCELDKYCRVRLPDLASNRKRIKAKFSPTSEPISYFFPPKWGINDRIIK